MEQTPQIAKKKTRTTGLRIGLVVVGVLALTIAAAATVYFRSQEKRYEQDNYLRANELYKQAFSDYERGGLPGYRAARDKLLRVLELQKTPGQSTEVDLPVVPNALTHNAYGLLAILSALLGECREYEEFSALTARVAQADWSINVMNETQQQINDEEKAALIFSAQQRISEAGMRCRNTGLPVKSFQNQKTE
jgi:hypothetical protein